MTSFASRRGSALLVVLGMLSFMLFSGLAFSVYLRQLRLPTSFLRRTVTTRQLAKAALAEAMNHLDLAIGNDPHPNVHVGTYTDGVVSNIWNHRVFSGYGTSSAAKNQGQNQNLQDATYYPAEVDPEGDPGTVATLTLEGLAYLPPNLINEVRYYSQRTPTAKWHSFWFDSGRYAYCAVDVSDYFDVNRVSANRPRASSAGRRVSFAHIFESGIDHTDAGTGAAAWDTFMKAYRDVDDDTDQITFKNAPFVSLADLNLTIGSASYGKWCSPFYSFVNNGTVYDCGNEVDEGRYTDETAEKLSLMTLVTDSWYPQPDPDKTESDVDGIPSVNRLDLDTHQPFPYSELNSSSQPNLGYFADLENKLVNSGSDQPNLLNHLCVLGLATLWDYLDVNRVPLSLAIPTLERTPMVVGVQPDVTQASLAVATDPANGKDETSKYVKDSEDAERQYSKCTVTYYLDASKIAENLSLNVLLAYPFLNRGVAEEKTFSVDGKVAIFASEADRQLGLTVGTGASAGLKVTRENFERGNLYDNAVMSFHLKTTSSVSSRDVAKDSAKPALKVSMQDDETLSGENAKLKLFTVTYRWLSKEYDKEKESWITGGPLGSHASPNDDETDIASVEGFFRPVDQYGVPLSSFYGDSDSAKSLALVGKTLKLHAAVWARVRYADDDLGEKTVDLVPACFTDDQTLNGVDNDDSLPGVTDENYPVIRYDMQNGDDKTFNFSIAGLNQLLKGGQNLKIASPTAVVQDPRYNYDPRNWYTVGNNALDADIWIDETAKMLGNGGRDSDFYLFTSDQGYMQSVYELAFLPRMTGFTSTSKTHGSWGQYPFSRHFDGTFTRTSLGESWSDAIDNTWQDGSTPMMWTTYRCYAENGIAADPFDLVGLVSGDTGTKVCPYSDSCEVLMAAFANTPHDWRLASTNDFALARVSSDAASALNSASDFNKKYAWNDYCSGGRDSGKLRWDILYDIADNFRSKVHDTNEYSGDWDAVFEDLGWSGGNRHVAGVNLDDDCSDLYEVDKKFLYGFWHDSFSVRQQLFLIFLRAEPMMVGGGVIGQAPPQLGAHAVALVWRDPSKTKENERKNDDNIYIPNPHRMRILFYHMFD